MLADISPGRNPKARAWSESSKLRRIETSVKQDLHEDCLFLQLQSKSRELVVGLQHAIDTSEREKKQLDNGFVEARPEILSLMYIYTYAGQHIQCWSDILHACINLLPLLHDNIRRYGQRPGINDHDFPQGK